MKKSKKTILSLIGIALIVLLAVFFLKREEDLLENGESALCTVIDGYGEGLAKLSIEFKIGNEIRTQYMGGYPQIETNEQYWIKYRDNWLKEVAIEYWKPYIEESKFKSITIGYQIGNITSTSFSYDYSIDNQQYTRFQRWKKIDSTLITHPSMWVLKYRIDNPKIAYMVKK